MTRVSVHVAQSSGERSHTLIFKIRTFRCVFGGILAHLSRDGCARLRTGARLAAHKRIGGPESMRVVLNSTRSTACVE